MNEHEPITPLPEGYTARPATLDDVEPVTRMLNAVAQALIGEDEFDPAFIAVEMQSPSLNLETDTRIIFAPDGQVAGWGKLSESPPNVKKHIWMRVHPDHVESGTAGHLFEWLERRATRTMDLAPDGARVVLTAEILKNNLAISRLFQAHGMKNTRYYWLMVTDLDEEPPDPQWPDGINVRTLRPGESEREVYRVVTDAFRDHYGYVERPFEEAYTRWKHMCESDPTYDPGLRFLAMAGDKIAGFSLCWPTNVAGDDDMGWVGTLGVRREHRRKGLALALLHHSFGEFYRRGKARAGLDVDASSLTGATRLYEKAGMHVEREYVFYEKELRPGEDLAKRQLDEEQMN